MKKIRICETLALNDRDTQSQPTLLLDRVRPAWMQEVPRGAGSASGRPAWMQEVPQGAGSASRGPAASVFCTAADW